MTPESVLYDDERDRYLVSNIHGSPGEADDNGFISIVLPDGKVQELKWIDGEKQDVTLNAPKGMAVTGGVLYVADITAVRKFAVDTGKPIGAIEIKGSTFLNDVTVAKDGAVYVSDSGLDKELKPSGTDAIFRISKDDKVEKVAKGKELGMPNGLAPADDGVWVVTFTSGELYQITAKGERKPGPPTGAGQLDGLVVLENGDFLFSSWEKQSVFRGPKGGPFKPVVQQVESPADIGWDSKRHRLLIPLFNKNDVWVVEL
jgi:sugar lactone lactonase YvrE